MSEGLGRAERAIAIHNSIAQLIISYGFLVQDVVEELNQARARVRELQKQAEASRNKIEELQKLNEDLLTSLEKVENWRSLQDHKAEEKASATTAFISGWEAAVIADREDVPENTPELALAKWIAHFDNKERV